MLGVVDDMVDERSALSLSLCVSIRRFTLMKEVNAACVVGAMLGKGKCSSDDMRDRGDGVCVCCVLPVMGWVLFVSRMVDTRYGLTGPTTVQYRDSPHTCIT